MVAHKDWAHLKTNVINLLLVGPAAGAGVRHAAGGDRRRRRGRRVGAGAHGVWAFDEASSACSGWCRALILLNSLGAASSGRVPLTFLLTAVFWLSDRSVHPDPRRRVARARTSRGALVGTAAGGYAIHGNAAHIPRPRTAA